MIDGSILVGGEFRRSPSSFHGFNPATGETVGPIYCEASPADVADACRLADEAAERFGALAPPDRAAFIEAVAQEILALGDELIATAMAESGLPRPRLEGERLRTANQLRMFATEVREGAWLDVAIDRALPHRAPPRPDLRRMNVPLGPVAVFGASNFPLAFSVAGGDTASAFAAGCPVVVKGHPAHPGTGELVARAVRAAVIAADLPAGVFSFLPGGSRELGAALVEDVRIKAVGFTGSRAGGLALLRLAQRRKEPIPVFAEMSSVNPLVVLPHALAARAEEVGKGFAASLTLGAGQFCTNPGLVLAIDSRELDRFVEAAGLALRASDPAVMLTEGIHRAYIEGLARRDANPDARCVAMAPSGDGLRGPAALHETSAGAFSADPRLAEELFGAASIVVRCRDIAELQATVTALEGQLTATIHLDPADEATARAILPALCNRAGRVLVNGWPTGVEVSRAMVHGGPFPATSDSRSTSVGTLAMMRFLRPICLQDFPEALLPPPLREDNPWKMPQRLS
jgi:NADP-dependent aldehyde dehydrogenase